jgi:uncharacterized MnhB-related membrane protein
MGMGMGMGVGVGLDMGMGASVSTSAPFAATDYWIMALLLILIVTSLAMFFIKNLLHAVIVFGAYSLIMALVWLQMNSPDLAITEAAAGIGMTVLMMAVIFRTIQKDRKENKRCE